MADPLTIFGAVASTVQIIDVLTKSIAALDTLRTQWQTSDIALLSLTSQLSALSAALSKIQEWMESGVEEIHHQLVMDLNAAITCCKVLSAKVYAGISDLQTGNGAKMLAAAKARFLFRRSGVGELQNMIDRQTGALTLLLTACNSKSLSKQQKILENSGVRKKMDLVKKDTESLRVLADGDSFLSKGTERSSRLSMMFDFDEQLFSSRPYKAMIRKTVKMSIRSPGKDDPGQNEVITTISSNIAGPSLPRTLLAAEKPRNLSGQREPRKIIMLGSGEAGKTTFAKQMQYIYGIGFPTDERTIWRDNIQDSIVNVFLLLAQAYREIPATDPSYDFHFNIRVERAEHAVSKTHGVQHIADFVEIYERLIEEASEAAIEKFGPCCLPYNLTYFAQHLERVWDPAYIPSTTDILHARTQTTGIHTYDFDVPEAGRVRLYDVGGERSERKKWIHVFDANSTVLFFVSMDGYNQVLFEDEHGNRLGESEYLFESIINSELWNDSTKFFLCFTRYDAFIHKLQSGSAPFNAETCRMQGFEGDPTNVYDVTVFVTEQFMRHLNRWDELGVFYLNLTDPEEMRGVINAILSGGQQLHESYYVYKRFTG